ncbi:L-ascorbate metabolism protein UlaG (beta-lactamase superfamily) [Actinocorallia herbida]|uniref:L-ascorbate metabolism protein UlaG (Beta-lactamase superfamily) n=1 Tax=Actinocorallia herbida TaxID=58109 RepID=A0A3N1D5F0_9ACTN|nr:MBL fold metallo-hydrolase [Actinocorallia herbida]ROO88772.1 L-ascorbate metabolism protein UlaG (beta-lactamase superfamily) [Actinocorallia herbida]
MKIELGAAAAVGLVGLAFRDVPRSLGALKPGPRVLRSPHFRDGSFHNLRDEPPATEPVRAAREYARREQRTPLTPVPVMTPRFGDPEALTVHWLGHGTSLVDIEGRRVLFDPVFSQRCSPSSLVGPKRVHPVPVTVTGLPRLDVIAITHDHYDHLDVASVRALLHAQDAPFVVPLGVGAHLERWGVPTSRIIELDWDEAAVVAGLRITATGAHHFSGRALKRNPTLWCSYVVAGTDKKVFYSGDSGYFEGYAGIGAAHGPFDVTLIQVGAYSASWPDIHMTPEEGVTAHRDLRGELMIPVHWGTFVLAPHAWNDPPNRVKAEAKLHGVRLAVPRPGERIDVSAPQEPDGWWETLA